MYQKKIYPGGSCTQGYGDNKNGSHRRAIVCLSHSIVCLLLNIIDSMLGENYKYKKYYLNSPSVLSIPLKRGLP